jgi:hypothetical protein
MAPRNPARPKAAHIPDSEILYLISAGTFPYDALCPKWPKNLVASKLHKLVGRGLLTEYAVGDIRKYVLTEAGREALLG